MIGRLANVSSLAGLAGAADTRWTLTKNVRVAIFYHSLLV